MKKLLVILLLCISQIGMSQKVEGTEVGVDGFFGASSMGGSFGIGLRYGWKFNEYFIAGPIVRYQRYWTNNTFTGQKFSYNAYGSGVFGYARFGNVIFLGADIEFMRSPLTTYGAISSNGVLAPAAFLGGGFSREFNESIRINAGIFYYLVVPVNSAFMYGYFMIRAIGSYIPAIY